MLVSENATVVISVHRLDGGTRADSCDAGKSSNRFEGDMLLLGLMTLTLCLRILCLLLTYAQQINYFWLELVIIIGNGRFHMHLVHSNTNIVCNHATFLDGTQGKGKAFV